jgi:nucleotide-binding universal stress UspA family protein
MSVPSDRRPMVAGVDPDPGKRMALAWAADEAARRRVPLRLVHSEGVPTAGYRGSRDLPSWEAWNRALHVAGEAALKSAVEFAEARQPGIEVSGTLAEGDPVWLLREQSRDASALVLGSWHLSRRRELMSRASVALPVLAHARCPVVVVPEPEHLTQDPAHVVVGVDGSEHSTAAVDLAFEEAALRGARLRALYVWQPGPLGVRDEEAARQEGRRLLSEIVAGRGAAHPDVELRHELVSGHPVEKLAEASAHALALVVGSRGRGGFTGMLLGSVSQGVLRHAHCPVIVVPRHAAGG